MSRLWLNAFAQTRNFPSGFYAGLRDRRGLHGLGRYVMQETPQRFITEALILSRKEDEFVPSNIYSLRWHRNNFPSRNIAKMKIFSKSTDYLPGLLFIQVRIFFNDLLTNRVWETKFIN